MSFVKRSVNGRSMPVRRCVVSSDLTFSNVGYNFGIILQFWGIFLILSSAKKIGRPTLGNLPTYHVPFSSYQAMFPYRVWVCSVITKNAFCKICSSKVSTCLGILKDFFMFYQIRNFKQKYRITLFPFARASKGW